ncbi:MAG: hypothetical protein ACRCYY_09615 [Trueperaceae bacterium]
MKHIGLGLLLVILLAACSQQPSPTVINEQSIELTALAKVQETQRLTGGGVADANFGNRVAVDGNLMVIACECPDRNDAAFIFERTTTGTWPWKYSKTLSIARTSLYDDRRDGVVIDGNTIVLGYRDSTGKTYLNVYDRNQGGTNAWGLVKTLKDAYSSYVPYNGTNLFDLSGNTLVTNTGKIFQRNKYATNNWGLVKVIDSSYGNVVISGDTVIASYTEYIGKGSDYGPYIDIYEKNQGGANNWGKVLETEKYAAIDSINDGANDVALSGDTLVISNSHMNRVVVLQRNKGGTNAWGEVKKLQPTTIANDLTNFGDEVSIQGDTIAVTSRFYQQSQPDTIYVYTRNQGGANQWGQAKVPSSNISTSYRELTVDVSGNKVVVGSPNEIVDGKTNKGAVYIFE